MLVLFAIVVDAVVVVEAAAALVVALRTNNPRYTDGTGKRRYQNQRIIFFCWSGTTCYKSHSTIFVREAYVFVHVFLSATFLIYC